jgi:hypothetical protein
MKLFTSPALLALSLFGLLPITSTAGAYNPAVVAADARWVVFADFDALRASTLGGNFISEVEKVQTHATRGVIGLDIPKVFRTIGTLTAYGSNLSKDPSAIDGALIAQGTDDLRKIVESILLQGTLTQPEMFTELTDLPFAAYAISDPQARGEAKENMQVLVAFPPEPIVVVSKSRAQLLKARDVFRGAAPSLVNGSTPELKRLTVKTAPGAYLFAASVVPTETLFPQNAPQARVLQLASSGAIAFGERGDDVFAHTALLASSENGAEKLMKILQGITAMLSLAETNDQDVGEFLNSTRVTREKDTVTLRFAYPSARLAQLSQRLRSKMADRPAPSRKPNITMGRTLAEWQASDTAEASTAPDGISWRIIENVELVHGATITVGRALNGG